MYYIEKEAEGEQLTLENTANEKIKKFEVFGNQEQETREGYNLLDYLPNIRSSTNGLTIDKDGETGYITVNGTPTANYTVILSKTINITDFLEDKQTYTLWQEKHSENNDEGTYLQIQIINKNTNQIQYLNASRINRTFTVDKTLNNYTISIQTGTIAQAGTFTNYKNRYMVYKGTDEKEFELYGASPSPDYPSKVKCLGSNRQLFDKTKLTDNSYINSSGEIITQTFWSITDYIPIIPNFKYTYQGLTNTGNLPYSAYYDENKAFISSFKQKIGENTITIPENAKFIRFPIIKINDDINNFKFEEGTEATSYSSYRTR